MGVEEPRLIAAVSLAAKIVREGGGFQADADPPRMIGRCRSRPRRPPAAKAALLREKRQILEAANALPRR